MKSWRPAIAALALAGVLPVSGAPGPVWLRLCDKRSPDGSILPAGTRAWEDAPVRRDLLDSLSARGWSVRVPLRWCNLVSATPPILGASLPACVERDAPVARAVERADPPAAAASRALSVDPARVTLERMHDTLGIAALRDTLEARGERPGRGVRVAVIDDGFIRQHLVLSGADVVDAWDFVDDDAAPWAEGEAPWSWVHGTATTGLLASRWELTLPGVAPYASLLLYRTEDDAHETRAEEDHLAAAIERAVDSGAQVISTSLGYRYAYDSVSDHPYEAMDGRTLVASRTATWAARRDVLVVAAMGNDASVHGVRSLNSPADADSILSVGAVSEGHVRCPFSSTGPSADGRTKPDLVAFGCSVPVAAGGAEDGYYEGGLGTSYATPLVAGIGVLLRQLRPTWTAAQIRDTLRATGTRAASPDSLVGWGVPDLRRIASIVSPTVAGSSSALPRLVRTELGVLGFSGLREEVRFELRSFDGRAVRSAGVSRGQAFRFKAPAPGLYVATWKGATINGFRLIAVPDNR